MLNSLVACYLSGAAQNAVVNYVVWDELIACYLFLAGLGAGAFAYATLVKFVRPQATKLRLIGYILAPVVVGIGTLLLVIDARAGLQHPTRFFYLLSNFNSIMSWGVLILIIFMLVGVLALVFMWKKRETPRWLDIVGLVFSAGVAVYTGLLLGDASAYPLWNPVVLPILFLVSATSAGFAAVQLVAYLMNIQDVHEIGFTKKSSLILPVLEGLLIAVLLIVTNGVTGSGAHAATESVRNLLGGEFAAIFWVGLIAIGLVLPFVCEFIHNRQAVVVARPVDADAGADVPEASVADASAEKTSKVLPVIACVGVLAGGFLLRLLVIVAALPITYL